MRLAVVRKSDGLVVETVTGTYRSARSKENADQQIVRTPENYDLAKCYRVVDGEFVQFDPPVTARHIEEARFREFRTVTDPMTTGGRQLAPEWADYVERLRNLTNVPKGRTGKKKDRSKDGLIARFPKRPDGTDAIEKLRNR